MGAKKNPTTLITNVQTINQTYSNRSSIPYIDTWIYVQIKYLPPPDFDLFLELESILELENEKLQKSILDSGLSLKFNYITTGSRPLGFVSEISSLESKENNSTSPFLRSTMGFIILIAGGILIFAVTLCCCCRDKNRKDNRATSRQQHENRRM